MSGEEFDVEAEPVSVTWPVHKLPRDLYYKLLEKRGRGEPLNFGEYRGKGQYCFTSKMHCPTKEEIKMLAGDGFFLTEHCYDGKPSDWTFAALMPSEQMTGEPSQPYYAGESRRRSARRASPLPRHRAVDRQAARYERERQRREDASIATVIQETVQREREAAERERERERQAMERERQRDREYQREVMENRLKITELEAKIAAPAQPPAPDAKTVILNDIAERTGLVDDVIDRITSVRSKLDSDGEPEPWYAPAVNTLVEAAAPHIGTAVKTTASIVAARVFGTKPQQQTPAQQQPAHNMPPPPTQLPAQSASAPVAAPASQPQSYAEASAIVMENLLGRMMKGASVHGSAREFMALRESYPQESAEILTFLDMPTEAILELWATKAPELKELMSRESSAAWLDSLKAEVKRRLSKQTAAPPVNNNGAQSPAQAAQTA